MGGDGHGHGHHFPKIPDWRSYKVKDVPELVLIEKALAADGLKDPWLRNEVWRYHKGFGTSKSRMQTFWFRGFTYGLAAAILCTIATKMLDSHDHGHGHEGDKKHH